VAFLFCDSFDHVLITAGAILQAKYEMLGSFIQLSRLAGRWDEDTDAAPLVFTDASCALMNTGFGRIAYYYNFLGKASGAVFLGVDIKPTHLLGGTFGGDSDFISLSGFKSSAGIYKEQAKIAVRNDGRLQVWKSTGTSFTGTMLAETAPGVVAHNVWARLEIRFTDATLVLRLNGVELINLAISLVDDTDGICRAGIAWEYFGFQAMCFDNLVVWDASGTVCNTWIGDAQVVATYVDDATTADTSGVWTASTGTALEEMVDERPVTDANYHDSDTTYITSSVDAEAVFKFLRFLVYGDIMGVAVDIVAKCVTTTTVMAIVRGSTDFFATGQTLAGVDYRILQFPFTLDPEGGLQWAQDDFIDQRWQFGVRIDTPAGAVRVTHIVVEVVHARDNAPFADYRTH